MAAPTTLVDKDGAPVTVTAGALAVTASVTATSAATATAANPSYSEGTSNPLSQDLSGHLRTTTTLTGSTSNASSGVATSSTNMPAVSYLYGFNGTTWDQLQVDGSKFLKVVLQAGAAIVGKTGIDQTTPGTTNAIALSTLGANAVATGNGVTGTGSLRVTIASDNTAFNILAAGPTASGSSLTANPVTTGGLAETTVPTAVADGQVVNAQFDIYGRQLVIGGLRSNKGRQVTTITSSTGETTIVTADATYKLDLYGLILANKSASATVVTIRDATGGGTASNFEVPAGDTRGFMLPLDAAWPQATANNNWTATCGTSIDSLYVTALYVKNL